MKLSPHAHKTFWDLHAWAGVITGLFLFVIFATGAAVVFRSQIETWQDPMDQHPTPAASYEALVETTIQGLGPEIANFRIVLPQEGVGHARVGYFSAAAGRYAEKWIDPGAGELVDRPSKLATLLYHIHALYHEAFPYLYYAGGFISLAMVIVVLSGLLIQLRNLSRQFHQFRAGARPLVRWNDMHKVLSVMGLPFQFFFAYSAVIIVLAPFFMQAVGTAAFDGDQATANWQAYATRAAPFDGPGKEVDTASMDQVVDAAVDAVPDLELEQISVNHPGHAHGFADIYGELEGELFSLTTVRVGLADAEVLSVTRPADKPWAATIRRWVVEIHGVAFGGAATKTLFALLSLAGAASMMSGIAVWLARRRRRRDSLADRTLERLSAGVGTATLVATGAIFVASRLLPWQMSGRWWAEELGYLAVWLLCTLVAFFFRDLRRLWVVQLRVAGALFIAAPFVACRLSDAGLIGGLLFGRGRFFGGDRFVADVVAVDTGLIIVGLVLLAASRWLHERRLDEPQAAQEAP